MLSFAPPIRLIDRHPIFADHQDAGLFYVLPAGPALSETVDGTPAFGLMRYLGDAADGSALAGGFLSIATELTADTGLATIRQRLEDELRRPVRLAVPLFDDGQVELILLGRSSGNAAAAGPFEVTVLGSGRPSMAGTNTAAFQIALNHPAAAFIEAAVGDPTLPALVIYRMALSGLQPAYSIRISGDLSRLQSELDGRFRANVYYVRADIAAQVREALTTSGVRVESTIMDETSADDAAAAERAVLDWITDTFFDAAWGADPPPPAQNIADSVAGSVMDLIDTMMPGVSFKLKMRRESDVRSIDAVLTRTTVRRRDLVFQATLGGELHALRVDENGIERPDWPELRDRMIGGVNIAAIPRREVTLGVVDRFDSDGLATVEIDIALPDPDGSGGDLHAESFVFHGAADRDLYAVNLLDAASALLTEPYRYRLRCHYDPGSIFGQRDTETGDWVEGRAADLLADPRVDGPYRLRAPVIGVAPGFPFAQFPQVTVETRRIEDGVETQRASAVLTPAVPETRWTFRGHGAEPESFDYRLTYDRAMAQGGPVVTDWRAETGLRLTLPDPLPHRRRATFFVTLPWAETSIAFLEIRYEDAANGLRIDERVSLSATEPLVERDYAIADPDATTLAYRLTAMIAGRGFVQGDWRETADTTIAVGRELIEMRSVRFRILGLPLADHDLREVALRAEALAPDGAPLHEHRVDVASDSTGTDLGSWSYPRLSPTVARVRIRADWRDQNGFPGDTGWRDWGRDLVLFRVPQMRFQE